MRRRVTTPFRKPSEFCISCGACSSICPTGAIELLRIRAQQPAPIPSEFEQGLANRKPIYVPFPQAVPRVPVIDKNTCVNFQTGGCKVCEDNCQTAGHRPHHAGQSGRDRSGQHHFGHRLAVVRLRKDSAIRLRPLGQCIYEYGIRAAVQRRRADQRQNPVARRRDRARIGGHHPLRGQPRREFQPVLLGGLLHGGAEIRAPGFRKDQGPGVFVLYRHAAEPERLRGVLSAAVDRGDAFHPRQGGRSDRRRKNSFRGRQS